jgi:hypothetical protein
VHMQLSFFSKLVGSICPLVKKLHNGKPSLSVLANKSLINEKSIFSPSHLKFRSNNWFLSFLRICVGSYETYNILEVLECSAGWVTLKSSLSADFRRSLNNFSIVANYTIDYKANFFKFLNDANC